jgi:flagellar motility protein MotE (MotC chaperone)
LPDIIPALEASSLPQASSVVLAEAATVSIPEAGMAGSVAALGASPMLSGASVFFQAVSPALTASADPSLAVAAQQSTTIPLPPNAEGLRQPQRPTSAQQVVPPVPNAQTPNSSQTTTGGVQSENIPPSSPQEPRTASGATLEDLARKEFELNRREIQLDTREEAIKELETSVNDRIRTAELKEEEINQLILRNDAILAEQKAQREEQQKAEEALKSERVEHLVAAFKSMKPEQAAQLINSMEDSVAVALLTAMPGRNAGLILGMVSPDKAARLVKAISEQRIDPRVLLENAELEAATAPQ